MIEKRIPELFLLMAAASLIAGVAMGIYMGVTHDHLLRPVHAHANLVGWASIAIFGLTYRGYRERIRQSAATLHLFVCGATALLFPLGLWLELATSDTRLIAAASLLWIVACLQFLAFLLGIVRNPLPQDG